MPGGGDSLVRHEDHRGHLGQPVESRHHFALVCRVFGAEIFGGTWGEVTAYSEESACYLAGDYKIFSLGTI